MPSRATIAALAALAPIRAGAGEIDSRVRLSEALLTESRGDLSSAIAQYTELSRTLPSDDPALPEALYWLGHALYALGREGEAKAPLLEGIRTGQCVRCRDLLETIALEASAITRIPVLWTFDGPHGLVHPWRVQDLDGGSRVTTRPGADPALEWRTSPHPDEPDCLVVSLKDPSPPPKELHLSVLSANSDSMLDINAEDDRGHRFALSSPILVPRGELRKVGVPLSALLPLDGAPPLDPARAVWISIVDRTGMRAGGNNTLWIDDFELR